MKTVTAAVVRQDGTVLLTRRGPDQKLAGYWEFPGGKVDPGETLQACLARELREELGVDAHVGEELCESIYRYDHGEFRLVALSTTLPSKEFVLTVHDYAEWVPVESLLEYNLAPADIPLAKKIMEDG